MLKICFDLDSIQKAPCKAYCFMPCMYMKACIGRARQFSTIHRKNVYFYHKGFTRFFLWSQNAGQLKRKKSDSSKTNIDVAAINVHDCRTIKMILALLYLVHRDRVFIGGRVMRKIVKLPSFLSRIPSYLYEETNVLFYGITEYGKIRKYMI